jgi:hypothetical protein
VKTRHVWMLPVLDVGLPRQGFVLAWRRTTRLAAPPAWEAFVLYVDERRGDTRIEWVPAIYLSPVLSERPQQADARLTLGFGP